MADQLETQDAPPLTTVKVGGEIECDHMASKPAFLMHYNQELTHFHAAVTKLFEAYAATARIFNNQDPLNIVKNYRDDEVDSPQSVSFDAKPGFMYLARHLHGCGSGLQNDAYSKYTDHLNIIMSLSTMFPNDPGSLRMIRKVFGPQHYLECAENVLSQTFDYNPEFARNLIGELKEQHIAGKPILPEEITVATQVLQNFEQAYSDVRLAAKRFTDHVKEGADKYCPDGASHEH